MWISCAVDQSLSDGSREVYILKCESVDMAPYAKYQQTAHVG
jgi:hypothetical protein